MLTTANKRRFKLAVKPDLGFGAWRWPRALAEIGAALSSVAAQPWLNGTDLEPALYRAQPLSVPEHGQAGFTRLWPETTGVFYTNRVSAEGLARNQILELGSGVALGDMDGDGNVDLYFCALEGSNRLYRNLGDWRFVDVTEASGVACPGNYSTGAVFADTDGDGDLDLVVNSLAGGTRLFANAGDGRFVEVQDEALRHPHGSTTLALADVEGDGWLDLYVATYRTNTIKDSLRDLDVRVDEVNGRLVVSPPGRFLPLALRSGGVSLFEVGEPDLLFRNQHGRGFERVSWADGTFLDADGAPLKVPPLDWGLTAAFRDLNGDRAPDLYVCNDFFQSLDQFWINDGAGRFRAAGVTALRHTSMSSMAVDFADLNRDGHDDFLVTDMLSREHEQRHRQRGSQIHLRMDLPVHDPRYRPEYPRNTLFASRGDGTYAEIAQFSGIEASEWTWSVAFLDVDLDGYEDVLITTGNLRDANDADLSRGRSARMESRFGDNLRFPRLATPDLAFRNQHDLTFREYGDRWGFDTVGVSQAMALADLDNDGDLDVVVPSVDQPAGLYRNDATAPRVAVRLRGAAGNTQGIGAEIVVRGGAVPYQSQEVVSGGRYLSGDDPMRVFAAGTATNRMTIEVTWRSGRRRIIRDARANQRYLVLEESQESSSIRAMETTGGAPVAPAAGAREPQAARSSGVGTALFEDSSARLNQRHQDEPYDELDRQPSLPRLLSRLGPGLSWHDVDENGTEDLLVGSGRGGYQVLYLNDGQGGFRAMHPKDRAPDDQTTCLAWRDPRGEVLLLVGTSRYEGETTSRPAVEEHNPRTGEIRGLATLRAAAGPLALTVSTEGPLLFVGGRVRPGRYPEACDSLLMRYRNGAWETDDTNTGRLRGIGLISGATWSDVDADGSPELVLACEWGSLRVLRFEAGLLLETTEELGLSRYRGWWNGVAAGDFDGDGQLDLIATNWGRNTPYERHRGRPVRLYYGDWTGQGGGDVMEAAYDLRLERYVPLEPLDRLQATMPALASRFATFADYARADMAEILRPAADTADWLEANWLESTVFLNRGDHFEARPLPDEAQLAPAFGVAVGDLDGDGYEDLVLAQNFFGVTPETPRHDAGRGLVLRGDGAGGFRALRGQESGVALYGEQRGCALADFDGDGRYDVAIGQHNGATGLFRNIGGAPGLRVRLRGREGNRDGLGAVIRLRSLDGLGPARLVQVGTGYWSQAGAVQVLGGKTPPLEVHVRWPGGALSVHPVPQGAHELVIRAP